MQLCNLDLSTPRLHNDADASPIVIWDLWRTLRYLWCSHNDKVTTSKTRTMPAHVVCRSCGWREPVMPSAAPIATRTWDSTRDEHRYEREKRRRALVEEQKQMAMAQFTMPMRKPTPRRRRRNNIVAITRVG